MARLYVGNLPGDIRKSELEDIFIKYGKIRTLDIKTGRDQPSAAFAFLEFDDARDAEDAQRGRNGYEFAGQRIRVETAKGGFVAVSSRGPPRRSGFRARVTGLPDGASWQDLKDHMREAGDVGFSNIERGSGGNNAGVVEYSSQEDLDKAISKLDRSLFKTRHGEAVEIRVSEDTSPAGEYSAPPPRRAYAEHDDRGAQRGGSDRYERNDRGSGRYERSDRGGDRYERSGDRGSARNDRSERDDAAPPSAGARGRGGADEGRYGSRDDRGPRSGGGSNGERYQRSRSRSPRPAAGGRSDGGRGGPEADAAPRDDDRRDRRRSEPRDEDRRVDARRSEPREEFSRSAAVAE